MEGLQINESFILLPPIIHLRLDTLWVFPCKKLWPIKDLLFGQSKTR